MLDPDDLLGVVREDLEFISKEFNGPCDVAMLRRASPVLRRLLVEGDLGRAWNLSGLPGKPVVEARVITPIPESAQKGFRIQTAGGVRRDQVVILGTMLFSKILDGVTHAPATAKRLRLHELMAAPCIQFEHRVITRHDVVKYVANKLGGAHHDKKRKDDDQERRFAMLDRLSRDARFYVMDLPVTYSEFLGTGQALVASDDIQKLWKSPRLDHGSGF